MGCATSSEETESSCENSSSNRKNRRRSSAKTAQKRGSLDGDTAKATKTKGSKRSNSLRRSSSGASFSSKGSKAPVAINPLSRPPPAAVMERRRNASLSTSSSSTNSSSGGGPRTVKVTSSAHGKSRRGVGPTSSLARAVLSAQLNSPGTSQSTSLMSPHHHNQRGSPSHSVSSHSNSNSTSLVRDADGLSRSQNNMDGDSYALPSVLSFNQDGSGGGGGGISTFASQQKATDTTIGDATFAFLHDESENSNDNSKRSDGSRVNFEAGVDVANLSCYSETFSHSGTLGDESRRSSDDPLHSSTTHEGTTSTTSCKSRRFADKFKSVLSATESHAPKILRPSSIECSVNSNLWSLENTGEDGSSSDEEDEEDDYQSALNE